MSRRIGSVVCVALVTFRWRRVGITENAAPHRSQWGAARVLQPDLWLLGGDHALGFPIAALILAITRYRDFAGDLVGGDLTGVFGGE